MKVARYQLVLLVMFITLVPGCTKEENAGGIARGKVLYNGAPLTEGEVIFQPVEVGSTGYGVLDSSGKFEMKTGVSMRGVHPGEYLVTVESWKIRPDQTDEQGNLVKSGLSRIPRKYTNPKASGLKASIKAEGASELVFELTGEEEKVSPVEEPE